MSKILVVHDDDSLRRVLECDLEEEGYAVAAAASGEEALEVLGRSSFELLVTDIKMAGIGGMELLSRVKRDSLETLVIVLTAFGTIAMAAVSAKAGAFEYVTKPFNRDVLKLTIRKALRRAGWNQCRAARLLKVPRHLLLYRMEKFDTPRRAPAE